eukprot:7084332-Pyramimonas_sp.AAC.1
MSRAAQTRMLRYMSGHRQHDDELMKSQMSRLHRLLRKLMEKHNVTPWDDYVLVLGPRWAGHVARMQLYDPKRIANPVLKYKHEYAQLLERTLGSQGHLYNFHAWRWGKQFYQYVGTEWNAVAWNSERWRESQGDW